MKKAKRVWTLGLATASILLANSASGDAGFTAAVVGIGATLYTEKYLGYDSDVGASDYFMIKEGSDCELQGSTNNSCTTHCPKGLKELAYKFSEPGKNYKQIKEGDIFSVYMKGLKLGDIDIPTAHRIAGLITRKNNFSIAVLANGFQAESGRANTDFNEDSESQGRVVYYSDDVKPRQKLNFGQLLIYGPVKYNGNPISSTISVVKLADDSGEKISPLLSSLASLGKNTDSLSPNRQILERLGTTLLRSQDVKYFRYDTTFAQHTPYTKEGTPTVATHHFGEYIVVRKQDRSQSIQVENLCYHPDSGVLYEKDKATETDLSYGVVAIYPAESEVTLKFETFQNLKQLIKSAQDKELEDFNEATQPILKYTTFEIGARTISELRRGTTKNLNANTQKANELATLIVNNYTTPDAISKNQAAKLLDKINDDKKILQTPIIFGNDSETTKNSIVEYFKKKWEANDKL